MKIFKPLLLLPFFYVILLTGNAQDIDLPHFSEEKLRSHIFYLASDSMYGRGINTPELELAANYIKENLQKSKVSSPDEGFFQFFTLTSLTIDKDNSHLNILNKRGKKKKSIPNFIAFNQNSNVADIEGELLFAGFGLDKSFHLEDNSENINYKGKIILYSAGTPESFREGNSHRLDNSLERRKMLKMQEAGAKALILVTSIQDTANSTYNQIRHMTERQKFTLNANETNLLPDIFIINPETADKLTGRKFNWGKTLKSISENNEQDLPSLKNNRVHVRSIMTENVAEAKNVIGLIEGSDSLLKEECIVFVAHYDHLGTNDEGEIYNGADDNASGVATLLELAGMFSRNAVKSKRSILFLFPSAEEIGLFGSDYYSQNPLFPIENTVACINLDMVGRVYEARDSVWNRSPKPAKDFNGIYTLVNDFSPSLKTMTEETCSQLDLEPDFSLPGQFFYTSDHYHFHKNQVPVLNISTGYSADYHKPTDTADRIRTDKMKRVAQLCYLLGMELGNLDQIK